MTLIAGDGSGQELTEVMRRPTVVGTSEVAETIIEKLEVKS